jgi:hypothetical protein
VEGGFDYFRSSGTQQQTATPAAQERFSAVATRRDGRWRIASIRVAPVPAPPEPPDPKRRRR